MTKGTIIVGIIMAILIGLAIFHLINHKNHCVFGCGSCPNAGKCRHTGKY